MGIIVSYKRFTFFRKIKLLCGYSYIKVSRTINIINSVDGAIA